MAPLIALLLRLRVQAGGQGAFTHADQLGELPVLKPGGEELIGFSLPVCQTLAEFWALELEA